MQVNGFDFIFTNQSFRKESPPKDEQQNAYLASLSAMLERKVRGKYYVSYVSKNDKSVSSAVRRGKAIQLSLGEPSD